MYDKVEASHEGGDTRRGRMGRLLASIAGIGSLPRELRVPMLVGTLNACGSGFTLPLVFLFLTRVGGLSTGDAGLSLGSIGLSSLGMGLVVPSILQRVDARRAFGVALLIQGLGTLGYLTVHNVATAVAIGVAVGIGQAINAPAWNVLLSSRSDPERLPAVFALSNLTYNLGIVLGSLGAGGLLLLGLGTGSTIAFIIDGTTFLVAAGLFLLSHIPHPSPSWTSGNGARPPALAALRDQALIAVVLGSILLATAVFSQVNIAFPGLVVANARVHSSPVVAMGLAVSTGISIFLQMPVVNRSRTVQRSVLVMLSTVTFGLAWLIVAAGTATSRPFAATTLFIGGMAVFGIAECLLAPSLSALVAQLAPAPLLPSYFAVFGYAIQVGQAIGPFIAGMGLRLGTLYPIFLATACIAAGVIIVLGVRSRISTAATQ